MRKLLVFAALLLLARPALAFLEEEVQSHLSRRELVERKALVSGPTCQVMLNEEKQFSVGCINDLTNLQHTFQECQTNLTNLQEGHNNKVQLQTLDSGGEDCQANVDQLTLEVKECADNQERETHKWEARQEQLLVEISYQEDYKNNCFTDKAACHEDFDHCQATLKQAKGLCANHTDQLHALQLQLQQSQAACRGDHADCSKAHIQCQADVHQLALAKAECDATLEAERQDCASRTNQLEGEKAKEYREKYECLTSKSSEGNTDCTKEMEQCQAEKGRLIFENKQLKEGGETTSTTLDHTTATSGTITSLFEDELDVSKQLVTRLEFHNQELEWANKDLEGQLEEWKLKVANLEATRSTLETSKAACHAQLSHAMTALAGWEAKLGGDTTTATAPAPATTVHDSSDQDCQLSLHSVLKSLQTAQAELVQCQEQQVAPANEVAPDDNSEVGRLERELKISEASRQMYEKKAQLAEEKAEEAARQLEDCRHGSNSRRLGGRGWAPLTQPPAPQPPGDCN